ncbi:MAG: Rho termination factor N-terminal domain-containing protein [Thermodesulfobacteriota bacterium]
MEKDIEKLTVPELREEAKKYPEITGVSAMKKAELIEAIRKVSGKPKKNKKSTKEKPLKSKTDIKRELRSLKPQKQKALENRDKKALKSLKNRIKKLKRMTKRLGNTISRSS